MRRSPIRGLRGSRVLVSAVLAVALGLLPGVARAEDGGGLGSDSLGGLTGGLTGEGGGGAADAVTGAVGGLLDGGSGAGAGSGTGSGTGSGSGSQTGTGSGPSAPVTVPDAPPELQELLKQLAGALQISPDCVDGVLEGVQVLIGDLTELPQDVQDLLPQLATALQEGGDGLGKTIPLGSLRPGGGKLTLPALDPSSSGTGTIAIASPDKLTDSSLADDLQALLMTFQYDCLPQQEPATPPSDGGDSDPTTPVSGDAPTPAQSVSYPGYAPTGAGPVVPAGGVPLAALGGIVLLSGVGAGGYRMYSRAVRAHG
jgi:hypothetical protein